MKYIELLLILILAIIPLFFSLKDEQNNIPFRKRINTAGKIVIALTIIILFIGYCRIHKEAIAENTINENEIVSSIEISSLSKAKIDSISNSLPDKIFMRSKIGINDIKIDYQKENVRSIGKGIGRYILIFSSEKIAFEKNPLIHSFEVDEINGTQLNCEIPEISNLDCLDNIEIKFLINIRNKIFAKYFTCNNLSTIKIDALQ